MDVGRVLGEIGILPEYREITGTSQGLIRPTWALVEKRRGGKGWAALVVIHRRRVSSMTT